ncbi:hypothetical protein M0812_21601 [Anaeramoeba flamelloides]|uniref:Uncharacterized protein n=1 Tax=Anaeramoeba flamelloides TaxID=1746091 RepID=A0AAV7YSD2_9EUKA|nr:hypothetical protein M0812_21601 [Anaeramoeba flamelloides]
MELHQPTEEMVPNNFQKTNLNSKFQNLNRKKKRKRKRRNNKRNNMDDFQHSSNFKIRIYFATMSVGKSRYPQISRFKFKRLNTNQKVLRTTVDQTKLVSEKRLIHQRFFSLSFKDLDSPNMSTTQKCVGSWVTKHNHELRNSNTSQIKNHDILSCNTMLIEDQLDSKIKRINSITSTRDQKKKSIEKIHEHLRVQLITCLVDKYQKHLQQIKLVVLNNVNGDIEHQVCNTLKDIHNLLFSVIQKSNLPGVPLISKM